MNESDLLALSNPDTFQDPERVHAIFRQMRAESPVCWCPVPESRGGGGFWSVSTYDEIQAISKDTEHFSSASGITLETFERPEDTESLEQTQEQFRNQTQGAFEGGTSMITMDPPQHTKYRRMVAPGFTPQKLDELQKNIRARAREILERLDGQEEFEFVSSVAAELPIQMLAELFGVPQEDRQKLFEWSNIIIGGEDPDVTISMEHVMQTYMEVIGYAMQVRAARNETPTGDLLSMLTHTEVDGEPLNDADFLSSFVLLVVAGNETTRNSISGGMLALSQNPEERAKLLADRSLIPKAVDEIIRWVAPVTYMRRTVLKEIEIGGQVMKPGDHVAMWYISGNRDESKWDNPFEFRVDREGPRHLAFGYGQHLCIGWRLAEMQLTILLEELLERFPNLEVTGDVDRMRTNFLNSIKRMDVKVAA